MAPIKPRNTHQPSSNRARHLRDSGDFSHESNSRAVDTDKKNSVNGDSRLSENPEHFVDFNQDLSMLEFSDKIAVINKQFEALARMTRPPVF